MATKRKHDASMESQLEAQAQGAKRFFTTHSYSDLVVKCKGQEWKVHKFQVCAHSEFFHKMCSGKFKEAKENKIVLDNDEPQVIDAMLRFAYTGTYADSSKTRSDLPPILLDVQLSTIADKYLVETLKETVRVKFEEHCAEAWEKTEFATAIREIYAIGLGDASMKDIAVKAVTNHIKKYLNDAKDYEDINKAIKEIPSFGADIIAEMLAPDSTVPAATNQRTKKYKCPSCAMVFSMSMEGKAVTFGCPSGHFTTGESSWARHQA